VEARPAIREQDDHSSSVAMRHAVAGLPPRQKAAVVLRYYMDLPFGRIADLLGVKESTAKTLVAKAIRRLRDQGRLDTREEVVDAIRYP
jgi:RNA polymerase sigma factor (sigma-70 family)